MIWSTIKYKTLLMAEFKTKVDSTDGKTRLKLFKRIIVSEDIISGYLAIDWVHDLLFYYNETNINVINIHEPEATYPVTHNYHHKYRTWSTGQVVVNPFDSFIVWSEYIASNGSAVIQKCNEDGSDPKILVYEDIGLPVCLGIDFRSKTIVWIDNELYSLSSVDYSGGSRQTLNQSREWFSDCSSMDVFNGSVYWTNTRGIYRLDITSTSSEVEMLVKAGVWFSRNTDMDYVRVMHPLKQQMGANYCRNNSCDHLCVPNGKQDYRCLCSDDDHWEACNDPKTTLPAPAQIPEVIQNTTTLIQFMSTPDPLFLVVNKERDIRLVKDIPNRAVYHMDTQFVRHINQTVGAIDYSYTGNYFVGTKGLSKGVIFSAPLVEGQQQPNNIVTEGDNRFTIDHKSLALDWIHNILSQYGDRDKSTIMRSSQNGQAVTTLVAPQYIRRYTLNVDVQGKRVYWVSRENSYSSINTILSIGYDSSNLQFHYESDTFFSHIAATDIFGNYMFWVNNKEHTIYGRNMSMVTTNPTVGELYQTGRDITAMKIVHKLRQPAGANKCMNHDCTHICLPSGLANINYTCGCLPFHRWNGNDKACVGNIRNTDSTGSTGSIDSNGDDKDRYDTATFESIPDRIIRNNLSDKVDLTSYYEALNNVIRNI
ncbi:unnamed protein product [Oppiella nova]|uniref:Uncharacterized protein n=1 Tax=Oppiella nova TaxID=334625 RepID=A0A7R9M319_9ACAR|nr:unnamed protein product [Oppiella nova]CAG2169836.1 unnamed protein product [Oppiella nova]